MSENTTRPSKRWLRLSIQTGSTGRSVLTLLSGTAMAQLVAILVLVPLAWLYSPRDMGLFTLFQSIVAFGVAVASLRYDMAIVLPDSDIEARVLQRLAKRSIGIASLILIAASLFARQPLLLTYGNTSFADGMLFAGVAVFLVAQISNVQFWLTRVRNFSRVARNRLLAAGCVGGLQLAGFALFGDVRGLIFGVVVGQLVALLVITWHTADTRGPLPEGAPATMDVAKRYKKMPLLNGPNAVVDALRSAGISFLIGGVAVTSLGQYNLAWQLTMAPASLIQGAVSQVLLQRMAVSRAGELTILIKRVLMRLAAVAVPTFSLYYWLAPVLFNAILGPEWSEAGLLARALVPWVFMVTFTSPLSNVFIVTERQQWMLLFAIVYTICPLMLLGLSGAGLLTTVTILGWMMAGLLTGLAGLAVLIARRFDNAPLS